MNYRERDVSAVELFKTYIFKIARKRFSILRNIYPSIITLREKERLRKLKKYLSLNVFLFIGINNFLTKSIDFKKM